MRKNRKNNKKLDMPYKSKAQAAYFNIHKKELEKEGVDVAEWNRESRGMKLPKKASKLAAMKKRKKG
jgi:hypothetical protein